MNYQSSFAVSATGMTLERTRVQIAALNFANANTVAGQDGQLYRPQRVVARVSFSDSVAEGVGRLQVQVEPTAAAPRKVLEPGHPLADAQGFVTYAGVDSATEMVTLMSATRAYEANLAAFQASRHLAVKALEIGA